MKLKLKEQDFRWQWSVVKKDATWSKINVTLVDSATYKRWKKVKSLLINSMIISVKGKMKFENDQESLLWLVMLKSNI